MKKKIDNVEPRGIPKEIEEKAEKRAGIELVFILDKSGSMAGMERDTIGGFNAMIEKQKKQEGKVFVTTILFSNRSEVLHDRKELKEIEPLTEKDYQVAGGTALLDAIGGAVKHIANIHKYARREDVPAHTMFVITTDGMENASREFSSKEVKEMIQRQEEKYGWEFLFVAANIDAVETAARIGIRSERAVNYDTKKATRVVFSEMNDTISCFRKCGSVRPDWAKIIDQESKSGGEK